MTYHKGLSDEKKAFLREYHNNYNKKYYQSSDSMKKSKVLCDFKRRYVIPPQILDTFGNTIPYLYTLQQAMANITPEAFQQFLELPHQLEFASQKLK